MPKELKKAILNIPVLGPIARILNQLRVLPERQASHEQAIQEIRQVNDERFSQIMQQQVANEESLKRVLKQQDSLQQQFALMDRSIRQNTGVKAESSANQQDDTFADDHLLDVFYTNFEDRFRGSEDSIIERLKEYLPYFLNAAVNFKKHPVLDIGSGRGELLQLLKDNSITAVGLDINIDMVKRANDKGLHTEQGDALTYLEDVDAGAYGAITGFHIVEHIPFGSLLRIFAAAHRALVKDGFIVFETPNPENVFVATHNFYLDPSHLHPLPPNLLAFALEVSGFENVEIKRLHPDTKPKNHGLPKDVVNRLYGPQDYAVIAYRRS